MMTSNRGLALSVGVLVVAAAFPHAAEKPPAGSTVRIETAADHIDFRAGDALVGRYVIAPRAWG